MITEKIGSGRFCSRSCANSRSMTLQVKEKISNSAKNNIKVHKSNMHNKVCVICGKSFLSKNNRKTCSNECYHKLLSKCSSDSVKQHGGNLNPNPNKNCKTGTYKGLHYDSSWELAFILYNMDNNIPIERNKERFEYYFQNKKHFYYPDFKINGEYYEIKNYQTPIVSAKIAQFPKHLVLHTLYKKDIKHCIDYCISKYGKAYWDRLT